MRMRLNKSGQAWLAALASVGVAGFLSACGTTTADFVYVTSAKAAGTNNYGQVDVFEVNEESGRMRQIPTSPFPSGGRNPVSEAVSTDHNNLYVVNRDDNTIVQFAIGNDGKLYPTSTVNTPGVFPVAASVVGTNLYVADTYQPLPTCSPAAPCAGSVASFPVNTNGTLGTPAVNSALSSSYWPIALPWSPKDVVTPTAILALPSGSAVFVAAYDSTSNAGYVFGFTSSSGVLSPMNGGMPFAAGVNPSGIAADPTGAYVFVTDSNSADVLVYSVGAGGLSPVSGSPFKAGNKPSSIVIDSTGKYAYVANSQDSTVTGYTVSSGALTPIATYATDTQPVAIGIDPSLNQYLYTANFLANTVSGFQVSSTSGTLFNAQQSPFTSNANPTALAAIPHGSQKKSQ